MMHLKKSIAIAAILAAATTSLAGCSTSGGDAADGPVTISFWNGFTASDRPVVEEIVKKFNDSQTDVKVDMTIQPWDVFYQKLLPAWAADEGPTIVGMNALQFPGYASKGVLQDMTSFYEDYADADKLKPAPVDATKLDGINYGVPMSATPTMLFYNKDLLEAGGITDLPTTLDELADDSVALTDYNASNPTDSVYGIALPDHAAVSTWTVLMQANGGGIISDDGKESLIDSDASAEAITTWADLIIDKHISPVGLSGVDGDNLFSSGKAAFYINGPWASAGFTSAGVNYGVVPIPAGAVTQTSTLDSTNFGVSAGASDAEKAGAEKLIEFWNAPEQQITWATKNGFPPTRSDVTEADFESNPNAVAFSGTTNAQLAFPGQVNFAQIESDVLNPTIQKILNGEGSVKDNLATGAATLAPLLQ